MKWNVELFKINCALEQVEFINWKCEKNFKGLYNCKCIFKDINKQKVFGKHCSKVSLEK